MYLLVGRYLVTRSTSRQSIFRSTVFIAAICLFCSVTAHWITTVYRAFLAFVYFQHGDAPLEFYVDAAQVTELVQEGCLMISILIGDSLIIHRLWVVWEHRAIVTVLPICSLAALTMCSAVSLYKSSRTGPGQDVFSDPWLTSTCILTLVTNVYSTAALIILKIWDITRIARPIGGSSLRVRGFLVIVVESAAIYATWAIFFTVTYQTRSLVQFIVIQSAPELVGIVNALIHTRVGLGWAIEAQQSPPASRMAFAKVGPTPQATDETAVTYVRPSIGDTYARPSIGDLRAKESLDCTPSLAEFKGKESESLDVDRASRHSVGGDKSGTEELIEEKPAGGEADLLHAQVE
ncbi:hypothetical protein K438DRAFT_1581121 [Mycena galopus ATCC 62051]|nr:hypothetical protein K438DRAFT_1581121 [Mycena galopus ATCC 62051]